MTSTNKDFKPPKLIDDIYVNKPESLERLCIKLICRKPEAIFCRRKGDLQFRENVEIPAIITDEIFHYFLLNCPINTDELLETFCDSTKCCLQICRLSNLSFQFKNLDNLCSRHNIRVLELFNVKLICSNENVKYLPRLCEKRIETFNIHNVKLSYADSNARLLKSFNFQYLTKPTHLSLKSLRICGHREAWYFIMDDQVPASISSLELSRISDLEEPPVVRQDTRNVITQVMGPGDHNNILLKYDVRFRNSLRTTRALVEEADNIYLMKVDKFPRSLLLMRYRLGLIKDTLLSLTLFHTALGTDDFKTIFQLKNLHHLDVGVSSVPPPRAMDRPADVTVWKILEELPNLVSLDVSATEIGDNLYSGGVVHPTTWERSLGRNVVKRLEFLGLCESEGCEVTDIYSLASQVSGYQNEHQIMTALQQYTDRPDVLTVSFNHLYTLNRHEQLTCPQKLLHHIVGAMRRYPDENSLLLTCTANLFFITQQNKQSYSIKQRQDVIMAVMNCISTHQSNRLIIRNLFLTLYYFDLPEDFIFNFEWIAKTILSTLTLHQDNPETNELIVRMCNALVCSMKHDMKKEVAKLNFVATILEVIKNRLDNLNCDEFMECSWSALWNVSDETPENSWEFIQLDGIATLEECFMKFSVETELHKNMMGLVGNIAEVKHLRKYLMKPSLISLFCELLSQSNQNIEVAYNSCGALAHIISDGADAWTCEKPQREEVRAEMYRVVEGWDINSQRNINYRSFLPILGLVDCDVAECVHWAVWALCNLSGINNRYCKLLSKENGREILSKVEHKSLVYEKTKELACNIIKRIDFYENNQLSVDS